MSPDNRGTRDLLHIIKYTWAYGSLYSTADDNKWKILLFIFSVLFVKTFRCFVSLCIHTEYFYSACWTAFIGANSSKIVAYWTAHTESSSACAKCVCTTVRVQRSGRYNIISRSLQFVMIMYISWETLYFSFLRFWELSFVSYFHRCSSLLRSFACNQCQWQQQRC